MHARIQFYCTTLSNILLLNLPLISRIQGVGHSEINSECPTVFSQQLSIHDKTNKQKWSGNYHPMSVAWGRQGEMKGASVGGDRSP